MVVGVEEEGRGVDAVVTLRLLVAVGLVLLSLLVLLLAAAVLLVLVGLVVVDDALLPPPRPAAPPALDAPLPVAVVDGFVAVAATADELDRFRFFFFLAVVEVVEAMPPPPPEVFPREDASPNKTPTSTCKFRNAAT